ncbi:hypothetical protein EI71_00503 [Anaeroplasma bactoclasticum]|uniref:FMN-binding protein n=2 Tax=Anaeroplasma bactoclasticum TaxID=2088 RepID=A0A397S639_9MOLU|nr:hypothetical protein EI71_00503 [Anaeroplasma bactoclasticum]
MKRYAYVSLVLGAIALICALLIAGFYMMTNPFVKMNEENKVRDTYTKIYSEYYSSEDVGFIEDEKGYIKKKDIAYDKDGNVLGYIYTTSGKNSYGEVSLMIGIKDEKVVDVEFLVNTESFASTVNSYVKSNYPSSSDSVIILNPYQGNEEIYVDSLSMDELDMIDTKCGATFGATLVKSMVLAAITEAKGEIIWKSSPIKKH